MIVDLKMRPQRAEVIIALGEIESLPKKIQKTINDLNDGDIDYLARTYPIGRIENSQYKVLVHSRTAAMSVIAHEAVHVSSFIFSSMGCIADFDNDEHVAYMVQYICEEVEKVLFE